MLGRFLLLVIIIGCFGLLIKAVKGIRVGQVNAIVSFLHTHFWDPSLGKGQADIFIVILLHKAIVQLVILETRRQHLLRVSEKIRFLT